jgi:ribA/ribD-fused uncharacterized protein
MIAGFFGEYRFLSNFWYYTDEYEGRTTVEHQFQAYKADDADDSYRILRANSPSQAKSMGRQVKMVNDWDERKIGIMLNLVREKFRDPVLRKQLLDTGDQELIELNTWGDSFWGQCPLGVGENWLGKILMQVREEIRKGNA